MLDHLLALPDNPLRLVVIGRRAPPMRLGRLRAQGRARELGSTELRLTRGEAEALIRELAPGELPSDTIDRIVAAAEGWVAGVVLQTLDLRRVAASTIPGSDEARALDNVLDEYVEQELLASLPPESRGFVYATAGLPWLSTDLCGAALGVDVGATLGNISRQFPFIRRDARQPGRFRYQSLVGESLWRLARTSVPERVAQERAQRAATWLIAAGELEDAARIALEMPVSPAMVDAILPLCQHLADRSDFETLERWLARLPEGALEISPHLAWWRFVARVGSGSGRTYGAEALLDELDPRAFVSGNPLHIGRRYLGRGMLASFAGREEEAREALIDALARLPVEAVVERMYATWGLGELAFLDGRDDNAAAAFKEAEACAAQLPLDELWSWFMIAPGRANGYAIRGDLHSALTKYRLILAEIPPYLREAGIDPYLRCRVISLLIEKNDLDGAWREYALIEAQMAGEPHPWHRHAVVAKARLLLADGRRDEAEQWATEHLPRLRRLPGKTQMVHLLARIWLERAEYPMVESWLADVDTMADVRRHQLPPSRHRT
jgi:ATP/maltotriose-dependent transcriptional regulator MalT